MDYKLNSLTETAENATSTAGSVNSSNQKKKICQSYFQTLLSCFLLLAIIGLTIVIILHSAKLNRRIQLLEGKIEILEASHGKNGSTPAVIAESTALQAQQMAQQLESRIEVSLAAINASLATMGTHRQQAASNISELRHHLQDLETSLTGVNNSSISELRHHLQGLEASLTSVNSSLRQRFAGCYEDRQFCTILPVAEDLYYRSCLTHTIPANLSVSIVHGY